MQQNCTTLLWSAIINLQRSFHKVPLLSWGHWRMGRSWQVVSYKCEISVFQEFRYIWTGWGKSLSHFLILIFYFKRYSGSPGLISNSDPLHELDKWERKKNPVNLVLAFINMINWSTRADSPLSTYVCSHIIFRHTERQIFHIFTLKSLKGSINATSELITLTCSSCRSCESPTSLKAPEFLNSCEGVDGVDGRLELQTGTKVQLPDVPPGSCVLADEGAVLVERNLRSIPIIHQAVVAVWMPHRHLHRRLSSLQPSFLLSTER